MVTDGLQRFSAAPFSYDEVGATAGVPPQGYAHLTRRRSLGTGRTRFEAVTQFLLSWEMHRAVGIGVIASSPQAAVDVVALLRIGLGPVAIHAPVRVVYVVDEPDARGFAYGTLPGHPECGEERFLVRLDDRDEVVAEISAFSRPGTRLMRWAGPAGRAAQRLMAARYLRALASSGPAVAG